MSRHIVATVDEIAPGTCKIVTVKGREIGVFHVNDEFFAIINRCPHQGAPAVSRCAARAGWNRRRPASTG